MDKKWWWNPVNIYWVPTRFQKLLWVLVKRQWPFFAPKFRESWGIWTWNHAAMQLTVEFCECYTTALVLSLSFIFLHQGQVCPVFHVTLGAIQGCSSQSYLILLTNVCFNSWTCEPLLASQLGGLRSWLNLQYTLFFFLFQEITNWYSPLFIQDCDQTRTT